MKQLKWGFTVSDFIGVSKWIWKPLRQLYNGELLSLKTDKVVI